MNKHKHDWLDQMFIFPDGSDDYEHDYPYLVQYCSDRECGQRQTVKMSADTIDEVRVAQGWPALEGGSEAGA